MADFLDSLTEATPGEPLTRPTADPLGDSFEAEALYNFFRSQLTDLSEDQRTAVRVMDRGAFRNYFEKKEDDKLEKD